MKILVLLMVFTFVVSTPIPGSVIVTPKEYGNPDEWGPYFQGDIVGPWPGRGKNGLIDERYRWTDGVVPYEIRGDFNSSQVDVIMSVFDDYYELTAGCIQFVPKTAESTNYIYFNHAEDSGCYSYVGMQRNPQEINYPSWCIGQYGSVQHEMYHALGFFHEQSRTDRDDYVEIMWKNIEVGTEGNFVKESNETVTAFGESYDYGSVMHYSGYGFSRNGELTIVTKDPADQDTIGQREGLSDTDVAKLLKMYNCPTAPPS